VSLSLTVLGSSGTFATAERAASGYLVDVDGALLWMDAGAGTWQVLLGMIAYDALGGVLLTHRHPDHTTDVFQALHALVLGQPEPLPPIPLWAPQETLDRLNGFADDLDEAFVMKPIAAGESIDFNGASLSFFRMAHPADTVGVRIEAGDGVIAYSADTGPLGDLTGLAHGAEVFVCEATLREEEPPWEGHLSAAQAARAAAELGVTRLVLTHVPPNGDAEGVLQEARLAAPGLEIEVARAGRRYEVRA
jgi:ribonuclease BN (tRNA processing enzyme)